MTPTHTFNVDVTNPGQFLACCGLLELATCADPDAVAHFDKEAFITSFDPLSVVTNLLNATVTTRKLSPAELEARFGSSITSSTTVEPITIRAASDFKPPFEFEIDWWLEPLSLKEFKTWSGSMQIPVKILASLIDAIRSITTSPLGRIQTTMTQLLDAKSLLVAQPFYFDATSSRHSRDIGFSIADLKNVALPHCAFTELMAFIALQRFLPKQIKGREYEYYTWDTPLPASIAAAVTCGLLPDLSAEKFLFDVSDRDDYHKQFSPAKRRSYVQRDRSV